MSQDITFTVTLTVDGDTDEMAKLFAQYLTLPDYAFHEDYGMGWGGYDGPFVDAVRVVWPGGFELSNWDLTERELPDTDEREEA